MPLTSTCRWEDQSGLTSLNRRSARHEGLMQDAGPVHGIGQAPQSVRSSHPADLTELIGVSGGLQFIASASHQRLADPPREKDRIGLATLVTSPSVATHRHQDDWCGSSTESEEQARQAGGIPSLSGPDGPDEDVLDHPA